MNVTDVIMNLEQRDNLTAAEISIGMQALVNAGMWGLQGAYGRSMMRQIEVGNIMLGRWHTQDAYGNFIPSRFMVKEGTKGSRAYVAQRCGWEWVRDLEASEGPLTGVPEGEYCPWRAGMKDAAQAA
jgi:hypothetical protein